MEKVKFLDNVHNKSGAQMEGTCQHEKARGHFDSRDSCWGEPSLLIKVILI